jgi:hypothetical protein
MTEEQSVVLIANRTQRAIRQGVAVRRQIERHLRFRGEAGRDPRQRRQIGRADSIARRGDLAEIRGTWILRMLTKVVDSNAQNDLAVIKFAH